MNISKSYLGLSKEAALNLFIWEQAGFKILTDSFWKIVATNIKKTDTGRNKEEREVKVKVGDFEVWENEPIYLLSLQAPWILKSFDKKEKNIKLNSAEYISVEAAASLIYN